MVFFFLRFSLYAVLAINISIITGISSQIKHFKMRSAVNKIVSIGSVEGTSPGLEETRKGAGTHGGGHEAEDIWNDNPIESIPEFFELWSQLSTAITKNSKNSTKLLAAKQFDEHYQARWKDLSDSMIRELSALRAANHRRMTNVVGESSKTLMSVNSKQNLKL